MGIYKKDIGNQNETQGIKVDCLLINTIETQIEATSIQILFSMLISVCAISKQFNKIRIIVRGI